MLLLFIRRGKFEKLTGQYSSHFIATAAVRQPQLLPIASGRIDALAWRAVRGRNSDRWRVSEDIIDIIATIIDTIVNRIITIISIIFIIIVIIAVIILIVMIVVIVGVVLHSAMDIL